MTYGNGQGQPKGREPVERVVDLLVHTPIGLAVMAWKRVPELVGSMPELVGQAVSKGCSQLSEAEAKLTEEVRKARMIGQVAVTFGGRQLRREVDARLRDARQAAGGVASFLPGGGFDGRPDGAYGEGAPSVSATDTATGPASPAEAPGGPGVRSAATDPPVRGAGARKAKKASPAKVSPAKVSPAKVSPAKAAPGRNAATGAKPAKPAPAKRAKASGAARTAGRSKAAGPGKAAGRAKAAGPAKAGAVAPGSAADLPIREYDGLSASQVVSRLTGLTPGELRAVRSYEAGGRGRRTVLVAIDRLLA